MIHLKKGQKHTIRSEWISQEIIELKTKRVTERSIKFLSDD